MSGPHRGEDVLERTGARRLCGSASRGCRRCGNGPAASACCAFVSPRASCAAVSRSVANVTSASGAAPGTTRIAVRGEHQVIRALRPARRRSTTCSMTNGATSGNGRRVAGRPRRARPARRRSGTRAPAETSEPPDRRLARRHLVILPAWTGAKRRSPPRSSSVADQVEARILRAARRRDRAMGRRRRDARRTARRAAHARRRRREAAAAGVLPLARSSAAAATRPTNASSTAEAALELVHTFALVHDDVMDGSDMRRNRDAVHRALRAASSRGAVARARHAASARGWRSSSATSRSSTPTRLMRGAAPAGARRVRRAAHRAVRRAVARSRRARRAASTDPVAAASHRPVQVGEVHRRAAAASRRGARRPPRRARPRRSPRSGCRSVRRSSCATTCSAPSARPTSPASRSATTSARARRRR